MGTNPYVGPRAFEEQDSSFFFGRDDEAQDLLALVMSKPLVLFYAPSGAGKSSLIKARLIPDLRAEEFVVLATGRVVGELPTALTTVKNIFVFNLLLSLEPKPADDSNLPPKAVEDYQRLGDQTLADYLQERKSELTTTPTGTALPRLLVIDQFEEIMTAYPERWQEREDFFRQLHDAMSTDAHLRLLLAQREEYVGALERYAWMLPGRLRTRFAMRRLSQTAALAAIVFPAAQADPPCPFAPGVAEKLVKDLSQIRIQGEPPKTGQGELAELPLGEFVEPVQLQVVCQRLWENLNLKSPPPEQISEQELATLGDVNTALAQFYEDAIGKVFKDPTIGVSEFKVRNWFSNELITAAGTRGFVFQGKTHTGSLDNRAVTKFEELYLIRGEPRAGGKWYELVHDRFIEPILAANRQRQTPLALAAEAWLEAGKDTHKLYTDKQLAEADDQLKRRPDQFSDLGRQFVEASLAAEQEQRRQRQRFLMSGVIGLLLILIGLTSWALYKTWEATKQTKIAVESAQAFYAKQLAYQAVALHEEWPQRALLLAREALSAQRNYTESHQIAAEQSLHDLLGQTGGLALPGHTSNILAVAFSPVGEWLVSASDDNTIILWDGVTSTALRQFNHDGAVNAVTFSPDGRQLASASADNSVRLWDAMSGAELRRFYHDGAVTALVFSPLGEQLVTASDDKTVRVWEVATGAQLRQFDYAAEAADVGALTFSPDAHWLAGTLGNTVQLWNVATGKALLPFKHTAAVQAIAFSPDGRWLASASDDKILRLWAVATGQVLQQFGYTTELELNALAFSPDGHWLAAASSDTVRLWDLAKESQSLSSSLLQLVRNLITIPKQATEVQILRGHEDIVTVLAFSADSRRLASGSADTMVRLWAVSSPAADPRVLSGHTAAVNTATFSHHGHWLASAGEDGSVRLWRIDHLAAEPRILTKQPAQTIWSLAFSADDRYLASTVSNTVRIWNVESAQELPPLLAGKAAAYAVTFSLDGRWLASGGEGQLVRLWDVHNLTAEPHILSGHVGAVWSVAFSTDGQRLASADEYGIMRVWDVNNLAAAPQIPFTDQTARLWSVAFSKDNQWLASASSSADGNLRLWAVNNLAAEPRPLRGHAGPVWSVAFSTDGHWLASAGDDKMVRLWNLNDLAATPIILRGHQDRVNAVAFSPAGNWLASSSADASVYLWTLPIKQLSELICRTAGRNFTWAEWESYFGGQPYHKSCPDWPVPSTVIRKLINEGATLARAGNIPQAMRVYRQTQMLDPTQELLSAEWSTLCQFGSLYGFAADVFKSCEEAVRLEDPAGGWAYSYRGVARALLGNPAGAREDFEVFVEWAKANGIDSGVIAKRERWINALEAGQNPFPATTLVALRSE